MVVLLIYMTAVVVILLNILIAQMSSTYTKAKKTAKLQYDVDRMLIITRLEHSRFRRFVSFFFFFTKTLALSSCLLSGNRLELYCISEVYMNIPRIKLYILDEFIYIVDFNIY